MAFCSASETSIDHDRGRRVALDRALHQTGSLFTRTLRLEAWKRFEEHFGKRGGWGG